MRLPSRSAREALAEFGARRSFAAYNRRDWVANTLLMDDAEYVFESSGESVLPGANKAYRGIPGYLDVQEEWLNAWGDLRTYSEGMIEIRRGLLLSMLRFRGQGETSGIPVDLRCAELLEVRDGKIER